MPAELLCFNEKCRARFAITEVIYNCPKCGGLLEAAYEPPEQSALMLKRLWRERRVSNAPLDQSGVWRYRELIPFLNSYNCVVTLREGGEALAERWFAYTSNRDALVGRSSVEHAHERGAQPSAGQSEFEEWFRFRCDADPVGRTNQVATPRSVVVLDAERGADFGVVAVGVNDERLADVFAGAAHSASSMSREFVGNAGN